MAAKPDKDEVPNITETTINRLLAEAPTRAEALDDVIRVISNCVQAGLSNTRDLPKPERRAEIMAWGQAQMLRVIRATLDKSPPGIDRAVKAINAIAVYFEDEKKRQDYRRSMLLPVFHKEIDKDKPRFDEVLDWISICTHCIGTEYECHKAAQEYLLPVMRKIFKNNTKPVDFKHVLDQHRRLARSALYAAMHVIEVDDIDIEKRMDVRIHLCHIIGIAQIYDDELRTLHLNPRNFGMWQQADFSQECMRAVTNFTHNCMTLFSVPKKLDLAGIIHCLRPNRPLLRSAPRYRKPYSSPNDY